MDLGVSGLASGFDWKSLVEQLADVERAGQKRLRTEQSLIVQRNNAYTSIKTQFSTLQTRVAALKNSALFDSRSSTSSDTGIATASAADGAALGTYGFSISQLATAAIRRGTSNVGGAISATDDVSSVTLSSAGFTNAITAGTFTVNGKQVTVATTDTLKSVFDKISSATGGAVTAAYSSSTDRISLTGTGEIVLGSVNDTSNFLQAAQLANNGTSSVTSGSAVGGVRLSGVLSSANLATPISDGGGGSGAFKINGITINFSASSDSVQNVLDRINSSGAGVTANYDAVNDRFSLANNSTGDVGVALEDVTGNFLAATGLTGGTLVRGKDLSYTVNGGSTLTSRSNTIDASSSGISGLSVNVLQTGSVSLTVKADTAKIKTAITDFVSEYNKLQSVINSQTASTTAADGKVTAGVLAADSDPNAFSRSLRSGAFDQVSGLSGSLTRISQLGYDSSGTDDSLTLKDSAALDSALSTNLSSVRDLFSNSTSGIATRLGSFIDGVIGEGGTLVTKQDSLTKQSGTIDTQVTDAEKLVQSHRQRLIDSFVAMETAQAKVNQQLQFLQRRFPA